MKRVSSAPGLSDLAAATTTGPSIGQPFKTPAVLAAGRTGKHNALGNAFMASAYAVDVPMETSLPLSPVPSADIVYAIATKGLPSTECLASMEMKDAPSLDLAVCMATPVVPDEGPGVEVRQRIAAITKQAEFQIRLRYAEEIAARTAVRMRSRLTRKRSIDDLDLHEILQELESAKPKPKRLSDRHGSPSTGNGSPGAGQTLPPAEQGQEDQPTPGSGKKSNVVPFRRPANTVAIPKAEVI